MNKNILKALGIIGICILIFSTCKKPMQSINLTDDKPISAFNVFSEVSVVQFDTGNDYLIGDPSVIHYHDGHYYILDSKTQQLFCFDEQGNFKFKIANQGKGPEEYNYITEFSIDANNEMLLIMDPVLQYVHFYSLQGTYLRTLRVNTGKVMGLNKVYALNDSTLIVTSITDEQLLFVDKNTGEVLRTAFPCPVKTSHLQAFIPNELIYPFDGALYIMPALSQEVQRVVDLTTTQHHSWDFEKQNNSPQQVQNLIKKIEAGNRYTLPSEEVGRGKLLNHHFMKLFETKKFLLAILEFDDNFVHVIFDKENKKPNVFKTFTEGISMYTFFFTADRAIGIERGIASYIQENVPELSRRAYSFYNLKMLSASDRQIIEKHDPLNDNPFMVVYKFKE